MFRDSCLNRQDADSRKPVRNMQPLSVRFAQTNTSCGELHRILRRSIDQTRKRPRRHASPFQLLPKLASASAHRQDRCRCTRRHASSLERRELAHACPRAKGPRRGRTASTFIGWAFRARTGRAHAFNLCIVRTNSPLAATCARAILRQSCRLAQAPTLLAHKAGTQRRLTEQKRLQYEQNDDQGLEHSVLQIYRRFDHRVTEIENSSRDFRLTGDSRV